MTCVRALRQEFFEKKDDARPRAAAAIVEKKDAARPRATTGIVEKKDDVRPRATTCKDDVSKGVTEKVVMLSWKLKYHLCFRSVLLLESFAHTVPL